MKVKIGEHIKFFDEDNEEWYLGEVVSVGLYKVKIKDIDTNSVWKGLEWEDTFDTLENKKYYKKIKEQP